jgi:hypothetical protein
MAEYTVVTVALVTAMLYTSRNMDCSNMNGINGQNCLDALLTVMEENYAGYSSAISDVHNYDVSYTEGTPPGASGGGAVDPGTGIGGEVPPYSGSTLSEVTTLSTFDIFGCGVRSGTVLPDNTVVDENGNEIGIYEPAENKITYNDGCVDENPRTSKSVEDCEGNELEMVAIRDRSSGAIAGFGYESEAEDCEGLFLSGNLTEPYDLDTSDYSIVPANQVHEAVDPDFQTTSGAIVDGEYYANTFTFSLEDQDASAEVVYFFYDDSDDESCAIMRPDWEKAGDSDCDPSITDDCHDGDLEEAWETIADAQGKDEDDLDAEEALAIGYHLGYMDPTDKSNYGCSYSRRYTD